MSDKESKPVSKPVKESKPAELEIDLKSLLMPLALIASAIIISVPISLSIYLGLRDAGLGSNSGVVQALECDEATPLSKGCLVANAKTLGINEGDFQKCIDNKTYDSIVAEELAYGNEIGVQGTPSIYFGENQGDKMRGFAVGPSITEDDVRQMIAAIKEGGIDKAVSFWTNKQNAELGTYETQLRDFYVQQGQSGATLDASIAAGMAERKAQTASDLKVQDYTYGKGVKQGAEGAKAVMMEFSDYECPYCQRFAAGPLVGLKSSFVDSGEMLFIFRDFPLESIHPSARKAANAVRCAGEQNKYFEMHDLIFKVTK